MQTKAIGSQLTRWSSFAALAAADIGVLVGLRRPAVHTWRHLPHVGRWLATTGCDRAVAQLAAAALWLAAVWLAIGLVTALAASLPGRLGRVAAAVCRMVLPQVARKLLAGTAGLGVLFAPATALAMPSLSAAGPAMPGVITTQAAHCGGKSLPPPIWPITKPGTRPTIGRPTTPQDRPTAAARDARTGSTEQVRPGDSLWMLAAGRLPAGASNAEIAAYWPRWYAANRKVVGPDPDLLRPGDVLHVPTPPAPFH